MARFSGRESKVLAGGRALRQKEYAEDDFCKFTNFEKLKPDLDLIAQWVPELAKLGDSSIHDPDEFDVRPTNYPAKIIGHKDARERALAAFAKTKGQ